MSIHNIDKTLTDIIAEYQRRVREAYVMSDEFALRPDEMNALVEANARALGARRAQEEIRKVISLVSDPEGELSKQAEMDALPQTIRAVENSIDTFLGQKDTNVATFKVLSDVVKALKLEQYA